MGALSQVSIEAITQWANATGSNAAAAQALVNAAAQSPYLASQFNEFFAKGGELRVGDPLGGTGAKGMEITIDPDTVNDYMGRGTELGLKQLATMFGHEMGHVLSPGGQSGIGVSPEDAVSNSHRAEGVALSSETIVGYQLGLRGNGEYIHSDNGQLGQAGAMTQAFGNAANVEYESIQSWTFDSPTAMMFTSYSILSPVAQQFGAMSGNAHPSVAPQLTYDQYNSGWWALQKCGITDPNIVDWTQVLPESVHLTDGPNDSCRITSPNKIPLKNGGKISLDATVDANGNVLFATAVADTNGQEDWRIQTTTLGGHDATGDYDIVEWADIGAGQANCAIRDTVTAETLAESSSHVVNGDGSITYHYAGGASINSNAVNGEYHMVLPNADGGQTIYQRVVDADAGYTVRQLNTTANGNVTFEWTGHQANLNSEVKVLSVTTELAPGYTDHQTDTNADGLVDNRELITATGTNPLATLQDIQSAEHQLTDLYDLGQLDTAYYQDFTQWTSDALVFGGSQLWTLGSDFNLSLDPIGAFYESRNPITDNAPSIADKTPVPLNAANVGLTATALASLDANADGKLSGTELATLTLWSDLNENGLLDANELKTPTQAGIAEIKSADYGLYTLGNSQFAGSADTTPDSHYRTLRDTDNFYTIQGVSGTFAWPANYIKINAGQPSCLIGTDGNDSFDAASFEQAWTNGGYPGAFNYALLTNFLGGDGDDTVGGSSRNDTIWGGSGDDVLLGYGGDDHIHGENGGDILVGQEGQDILNGGAGDDLLLGGLGEDSLWGGEGQDELNGGEGQDRLYGEAGSDRLFGQVGDDVLYGGEGNDLLMGFTGTNETKQTLDAGETDNDWLYGGAGNDTLLGGLGNDTLDGGAGADIMEGGAGDDSYIVNSVNDVILEHAGEGHDTVTSSVNYLLNANVEDLRLLPGLDINGSGNALDNRIVGNSHDNILDGVTGADTMIGGTGNDTYYVDNSGDQTVELANEGVDTVQSTLTTTLGADLENLILLDFTKPEKGLVDGQPILVYGYPKANELDYMQGNAVPGFTGTCALTSIANLLSQTGTPTTEGQVVQRALENGWTVGDLSLPNYVLGGSNFTEQQQLLDSYGTRNDLLPGYNENALANLLRSGRGVILAVNAGALWNDANYASADGSVNHVVTVTGVAVGEANGEIAGFYIADSGRGKVSDMTRFVGIDEFRLAANVGNGYAIYTLEPLKMWDENIDGHGNVLDNVIVGNRGDNLLTGEGGNDTLEGSGGNDSLDGGLGDDTYVVDSQADTVVEYVGEGTDTVQSWVSYTLGNNVENLTLVGGNAINGAGNGLGNRLTGNANANVLDGGAGDDAFAYTGGLDSYDGGIGTDTVDFSTVGSAVWVGLNYQGVEGWVMSGGNWQQAADLVGIENIVSTAYNDTFIGNGSDNRYTYVGGLDTIDGGADTDTVDFSTVGSAVWVSLSYQGVEAWVMSGGNWQQAADLVGIENIVSTAYNDIFFGDGSDNRYTYVGGLDTIDGGAGTDTVDFSTVGSAVWVSLAYQGVEGWVMSGGNWQQAADLAGIENVVGTAYNDIFFGDGSDNRYTYVGGLDTIDGGAGTDTVDFSAVGSAVWVSLSYQGVEGWVMSGGNWQQAADLVGIENVVGTAYNDIFFGDGSDNRYTYIGGLDTIDGGAGMDTVDFSCFGSAVWVDLSFSGVEAWTRDTANITTGTWRTIADLASIENVTGTAYNDLLTGDGNANVIAGGAGNDLLKGNAGADLFVFDTALSASTNVDTISDFTTGSDKIVLDHLIFTALAAGNLAAGSFVAEAGASAHDANDFILYDTSMGNLSYDADGSGAIAATLLATLTGHPTLAVANLSVT